MISTIRTRRGRLAGRREVVEARPTAYPDSAGALDRKRCVTGWGSRTPGTWRAMGCRFLNEPDYRKIVRAIPELLAGYVDR